MQPNISQENFCLFHKSGDPDLLWGPLIQDDASVNINKNSFRSKELYFKERMLHDNEMYDKYGNADSEKQFKNYIVNF